MIAGHTPGPLTVEREQTFPFKIVTKNAEGEIVWVEHTCAYSSEMRNLDDLHSAHGFDKDLREVVIAANERQWADAVLRAAAPELLEALRDMVSDRDCLSEATIKFARAAIAKATKEQQ